MSSIRLFTDDIGRSIKIPVKEKDLTDAVSVEILVTRPDGEEVTWAATASRRENDPNFIDVIHVIEEDDIDKSGRYSLLVHAKTPDGEIMTPMPAGIILQVKERQTGERISGKSLTK